MTEKNKEDSEENSKQRGDQFAQFGQQAGAMFGQLFEAAEQFGRKVSSQSESWSDLRDSEEPLASAFRKAGEDFKATANQAVDGFSEALRNQDVKSEQDVKPGATVDGNATETQPGTGTSADEPIIPGKVHRIGGGPIEKPAEAAKTPDRQPASKDREADTAGAGTEARQRANRLAEMFYQDTGLGQLSSLQFDELEVMLKTQYRSLRNFQDKIS